MGKTCTIEIDKNVFLPCYWHLLNIDADIHFLWGSRDSGKSWFIAQRLVLACLGFNDCNYFRCILIKKTAESIKDAQWQTIKDVVDKWNLEAFFDFKISPLEINCINGNKFIARGCDKPEKLKSIANPSHAWFEEGNQLTEQDYIVASTTLRAEEKVEQWFSFNPECAGEYTDYWLYKNWFANHTGDIYNNFIEVKEVELPDGTKVAIRYTSTHTTYQDNPHCKPDRRAKLEALKISNPYYWNVYANGRWGNKKNDSPFAFAFDKEKHVSKGTEECPHPIAVREQVLYLSFDFNRNPICCSMIQWYDGKVIFIETIKLANSDIYKLCDWILVHYPGYAYMVGGDASGKGSVALVQDGINYYTVIKSKLGLSDQQFRVPSVNPRIEENQVLFNAVIANYPVVIHAIKCKALIFDLENVKMLPKGVIDKTDREDPTKQADALDTARYWFNVYFWNYLKQIL